MFVNGIFCKFFFYFVTLNILWKDTLSRYLEIPVRFTQVKTGQVKAIQGITGQKISNMGNVQLSTELLGHKSVGSFIVLPNTTFGAEALIGYKTMRRWGLVLDCKTEEAVLNHRRTAVCLQLEDETSLSNVADLTETTSTSVECMPTVGAHHGSITPVEKVASVKGKTPLPSVN